MSKILTSATRQYIIFHSPTEVSKAELFKHFHHTWNASQPRCLVYCL